MVERPHRGPLPLAHPVAHGRPPTPDGSSRYPVPPPPLPRRQLWPGLAAAAIALAVMVLGIAGCLP